jgi:Ca2+-dependent lipid-binding protein
MKPPGPGSQYGALTIRVISASNLASASFVGKVNPFAICKIGSQEQQTKVVPNGGKKPVWGDTFDFSIST